MKRDLGVCRKCSFFLIQRDMDNLKTKSYICSMAGKKPFSFDREDDDNDEVIEMQIKNMFERESVPEKCVLRKCERKNEEKP